MPRVLHTAQALVDVILEIDELPPRGGNANARSETWYAGGAVTTLIAAARTGATAVHGGAHGTGPHGDVIREALARDGVTLSDAKRPDIDTGYCTVLLEPSAERTFLTVYGAERDITAASLATLEPEPGDLVCVSGYSLFEPTRAPLLEFLEALPEGVDVVLDPGAPFATFPREVQNRVLSRTTVWTSNADEAKALTQLDALEDTPESIRRWLAPGAAVVVRDGERGCMVFHHGRGTQIPAFPQKAVDTNGAGDTHTGVLLAERALGTDWESAATRANAAAAIAVTRHGTESAPTRAEVDAFLA
ncbi:MAG: PfkB family carbohydrate kinase [Brachybacterium sp.]